MTYLTGDCDFGMGLVAEGTAGAVGIVEDDRDGGLCNAGLALLVDELLEIGSPDLLQICDAQDEADGVEDVGFARPVETRYGVEKRVEPGTTVLVAYDLNPSKHASLMYIAELFQFQRRVYVQ